MKVMLTVVASDLEILDAGERYIVMKIVDRRK